MNDDRNRPPLDDDYPSEGDWIVLTIIGLILIACLHGCGGGGAEGPDDPVVPIPGGSYCKIPATNNTCPTSELAPKEARV